MLKLLRRKANRTYTENGAATLKTSYSDCLDLFARIGAMRNVSDAEIIDAFTGAFIEDPDLAMKILFFARDIRGGLGERRVFRVIMNWLARFHGDSVRKNIANFAEFGRYDDIVELIDTPCREDAVAFIREQLDADLEALERGESVSLLAKWLPSVNASNKDTIRRAKAIARELGMRDAQYRKVLSRLRAQIRIIENSLRERDYSFDYTKQPSRAMYKYRAAFRRNDGVRYLEYLDQVSAGRAKIHTTTLMPYDIIAPIVGWSFMGDNNDVEVEEGQRKAMDVTWNALEDFSDGRNALVVVDGSGSMYGMGRPLPAAVALSLGIYYAERNTGVFRNHFITFSRSPRLVEIKGRDIFEKTLYCERFNEVANTDLQKVFELLLSTAVENRVPQRDMPETLYIISDMEFDYCIENSDMTNFEYARELFARYGYKLPQVVFWNVDGRHAHVPVTMNEQGVALVSGCTPRLFSAITHGSFDPYSIMMETVCIERYASIVA